MLCHGTSSSDQEVTVVTVAGSPTGVTNSRGRESEAQESCADPWATSSTSQGLGRGPGPGDVEREPHSVHGERAFLLFRCEACPHGNLARKLPNLGSRAPRNSKSCTQPEGCSNFLLSGKPRNHSDAEESEAMRLSAWEFCSISGPSVEKSGHPNYNVGLRVPRREVDHDHLCGVRPRPTCIQKSRFNMPVSLRRPSLLKLPLAPSGLGHRAMPVARAAPRQLENQDAAGQCSLHSRIGT
eukprot:1811586-Rhodomonas_salina.1